MPCASCPCFRIHDSRFILQDSCCVRQDTRFVLQDWCCVLHASFFRIHDSGSMLHTSISDSCFEPFESLYSCLVLENSCFIPHHPWFMFYAIVNHDRALRFTIHAPCCVRHASWRVIRDSRFAPLIYALCFMMHFLLAPRHAAPLMHCFMVHKMASPGFQVTTNKRLVKLNRVVLLIVRG